MRVLLSITMAVCIFQPIITLEMPALGRFARIGELFDATADNFTGEMVFRKALPPQLGLVHESDTPLTETSYAVYSSLKDKINFLGISGALAIEVKTAEHLVKMEGQAGFIRDEKKSTKHAEGVFSHKTLTKKDSIQLTDEDVKPYVSTDILLETTATHVVTGAYYGGDVYVKLVDTNMADEEVQKITGNLELTLKFTQAFFANASGNLNMTDSDVYKTFNYSLEVFGDILIDKIPGCALEVQELIQSVPDKLKRVNGGKGKPMKYVLTPVSELRSAFKLEGGIDKAVHSLDEDKLNRILVALDEISEVRQQLNDLSDRFDSHMEVVPLSERTRLRELASNFSYTALEFQANVREALVTVRTNGNQTHLAQVHLQYIMEPFSADKVKGLLDYDYEATERKIPFYENFRQRGIDYLGKSHSLGPYLIHAQSSIVYIVYFNISLMEADGAIWEENRELLGYIAQDWSSIAVLDCDFWTVRCAGLISTVIQGYFKGRMGTVNARLDMPIRDESIKNLPAIGRNNKIGDLYDATTGIFTDESIFLTTEGHNKIQPETLKTLGYCKTIESKGWEGLLTELKSPSELGSLLYREKISLEGSGEIFLANYNPPNLDTADIVCINKTRIEALNTTADQDLFDLLDMATITRTTATHFIEKVEYGAASFVTFFNEDLPAQSRADADLWLPLVEKYLTTTPKSDKNDTFPATNTSQIKLFSDISPRYIHALDSDELQDFLEQSSQLVLQFNEGKGIPVMFQLRPISILKKNFAVASKSNVVPPEHEELKRNIVSQCGKIQVPVTCIDRRFHFFDVVTKHGVGFIYDDDSFENAFSDDQEEELVYMLFFRYQWVELETVSWVENSEKFYNLIHNSTAKFGVDCNFFEGAESSVCVNVTKPAIYVFRHGELIYDDFVKELVDQAEETRLEDDSESQLLAAIEKSEAGYREIVEGLTNMSSLVNQFQDASRTFEQKLLALQSNPPPLGFIYVQHNRQTLPTDFWPSTHWNTIEDTGNSYRDFTRKLVRIK